MMRKLMALTLTLLSVVTFAQTSDLFTPVKPSALRLPSVPLVSNDPYFAIWSSYDHLYDGVTSYFSGARKQLTGIVRVDGENYRFMGVSLTTLVPMAHEQKWDARYVKTTPSGDWYKEGYDDSSWNVGKGAFGGGDGAYGNIGTSWSGADTDVYVRRTFNLTDVDPDAEYHVVYKHDDVFQLYLNGEKIAEKGNEWNTDGVTVVIKGSKLKQGENLFAAHCHNTTGGAYLDFGLYLNNLTVPVQNYVQTLATNTYYNFTCGPVDLDVVFTSPQIIDDPETLSFPATFISYQAKSNDGQEHSVQIYISTSAELAVSNAGQSTNSARTKSGSRVYTKGSNKSQNPVHTTGDGQIDWGTLYFYSDWSETKDIVLGDRSEQVSTFLATGKPAATKSSVDSAGGTYPSMGCVHDLGNVDANGVSSYVMLAYDDTYSINYMGRKLKAYWTSMGSRTSFTAKMKSFFDDYDNLMQRCRDLDERIYNDGFASGGAKYAEILSGVFRETMTAHKLVADTDGTMLWFSRENNSGGFINTVDITYPSAPLFLMYNPDLCRAMITPQFDYPASGKWTKGFAAHDLGPYPTATGQTYGGDMPLEESADMIILSDVLYKLTGNTEYAEKYWDLLTTWTDYLVENGRTPTNQLCTDDFMGPSEKNANLSLKSCIGVYCYADLARMLGKTEVADLYDAKALEMDKFWKNNAMTKTGDKHSKLAIGGANNTWSEKYNMVWDMMLGWDHFKDQRLLDMAYYQTKMLPYGLPLDSRGDYNKNDWHFWVAAMAKDVEEFLTYVDPMYKYVNETPTRVPLSDYHDARTGARRGYMARPVVAGYWMKVLMDKFLSGDINNINKVEADGQSSKAVYDISGRRISEPHKGVNIIEGKKIFLNK